MTQEQISDQHFAYLEINRHWHAGSEKYTGADALVTALTQGWNVSGDVVADDHYFAGNRSIRVYEIPLRRDGETVTMQVIHNPYLTRMLSHEALHIQQS